MKKLAIVGTVGLPANYGGFETLTEYLVKELSSCFEITVYCSKKRYNTTLRSYNNAKLVYINLDANGLSSIAYDILSLRHAKKYADIILLLGVSGTLYLPFINRKKTIIVTNIDGLEWRREKWGKLQRKLLHFLESLAVKYSTHVVADNQAIVNYVSQAYNKQATLIEYGGDHVFTPKLTSKDKEEYPFLNGAYSFMVARIEPENNISLILEAFTKTEKTLVLVGNWHNSQFSKELKAQYSIYQNIHLIGPIYDQTILNKLRAHCSFYIHGHSAGGTNPSLVEAMNLSLDIIAYDCDFNRFTTQGEALYFSCAQELTTLIEKTKPSRKRKTALHEIAQSRYTWKIISKKYKEIFSK